MRVPNLRVTFLMAQMSVLPIGRSRERVSLLEYEEFDDHPFPALLESRLVEADGRVARRDYRASANPPILHRKELLLPAGHPRIREFAALTGALEAKGLFDDANRIGTRNAWAARLKEAGIGLDGHSVGQEPSAARHPAVARHKTAITRQRLRAYIGCAEKLYGTVDSADVLKIHIGSGKLTLLSYEGYADTPLPRLTERIKIKLKDVDWDEFAYGEGEERVLVLKSLLMAPDQPGFAEQEAFDGKVRDALPELVGPVDLPKAAVDRALKGWKA